jgi:hypothetical protein
LGTAGTVVAASGGVAAAQTPAGDTYRVTIQNISAQPFAPPVAATHRDGMHVFQIGAMASDQIATVAQEGNPVPLAMLLAGSAQVTEAVNVGHPIPGRGMQRVVDGTPFTDTTAIDIHAMPGDRFSLAGMLACTNDGFFGLDSVVLPAAGTATYAANSYDAGREENTQRSEDLGDPCSVLGSVPLRGDPNGNAAPATNPRQTIRIHPGITATGDLTPAAHGWQDPVARVTISRVGGAPALPHTGSGPAGTILHFAAAGLAALGAGLVALRRRRG